MMMRMMMIHNDDDHDGVDNDNDECKVLIEKKSTDYNNSHTGLIVHQKY